LLNKKDHKKYRKGLKISFQWSNRGVFIRNTPAIPCQIFNHFPQTAGIPIDSAEQADENETVENIKILCKGSNREIFARNSPLSDLLTIQPI
jgi:hypothetical protein